MPDPNGTAVVMKFKNILDLEQYLYSVSTELHTNLFEIAPLQLNKHAASKTIAKCIRDKEYQKKRCSLKTEGTKIARLQKAIDYKKRKQSKETDSEKQSRLKKDGESKKRRQFQETESQRQIRLEKDRESKKQKQSEETESQRQIRLEKNRLCQKERHTRSVSQPHSEINQQDYLNTFDIHNNGGIEEQFWANANMNRFCKSVQYIVSQCTVCKEVHCQS